MKNIGQLMKQAQEFQTKMTELQSQLESMEVDGQSGGGLVTAKVDGKGNLKSVSIDPTLLTPDEKEVLEDLIVAAQNDGKRKADDIAQEEMQKLTGGLPLPPGMKLPF